MGDLLPQLHPINHNKVVVISSNNLHANCSNCIILGQILFTCYISYMSFQFVCTVSASYYILAYTYIPLCVLLQCFYVCWEKDAVTFCKD